MKITVKYFGVLAEKMNRSSDVVNIEEGTLLSEFLNRWENSFDVKFKVAVNHKFIEEKALEENDEIAFLPPFSGG